MGSEKLSRTALVLYGSETGNAQDVAEELGRLCQRLHFSTHVAELNEVDLRQILGANLVLVSISTTGQGELPANAQRFWRSLRSARLLPGSLRSLRFASFGLGDSSYPQYNWAHRKLYNRLVQLGASPICERGEADEQHPDGVDGALIPWTSMLRNQVLQSFPLPNGLSPIPDDVLLEPQWTLEFLRDLNGALTARQANAANGETRSRNTSDDELPPDGLLDIIGGFPVRVDFNSRATAGNHWQDVRHLSFSTDETYAYGPGDVLTLYPKNFPKDVEHFISLMAWETIADSPLYWRTDTQDGHVKQPQSHVSQHQSLTLRELLTCHLDIMSIPRRSFFAHIMHYTNNEFHRERLQEFTDPQYLDELYDYTSRPRRSILEVLDEFTSVKLPWQKVCSILPVMRGRQFSIASGGALKKGALIGDNKLSRAEVQSVVPDSPATGRQTKFELIVAVVKYRTVIKRIRQGVATRYIATLKPGQQVTVTLNKGGLAVSHVQMRKPVVMVGPGTGVAPLRSLIYERLESEERRYIHCSTEQVPSHLEPCSRALLFFGCRNESADYLFRDEWERLTAISDLQVHAAFSRDQRQKHYVQDLLRQQGSQVCSALIDDDGMIYLCGSSGKMPQAVREALIEVFSAHPGYSRGMAEAFLVRMEKEGRYKQETW